MHGHEKIYVVQSDTYTLAEIRREEKKTEGKMINHEWSMEKTKVYIELKYTNALVVQFDDTPNSGVMIK